MKKFSRCLALVGLAAVSVGAVGALTSCGGTQVEYEYDEEGNIIGTIVGEGDEELVVWCPELAVDSTTELISDFCKEYKNFRKDYHVRIEVQGEGDAATNVITDVTSAADVFFFAQDQLARLVQVGGLSPVSSTFVDDVTERNDAGSVAAGKSGETLYAYPLTSDNGYFAYYDKSVPGLEAEFTRVGGPRQEKLIEICEEQKVTICFELSSSGWYLASYFFATGCVSDWYTDDKGTFTNRNDTWNSDAGLIAAKGAYELMSSDAYRSSSDASTQFNSGAGIVVSGTWDSTYVQNILGEDMGVSELWNFTVDEQSYHLGSFSGYKLIGVRPNSNGTTNVWSHTLANYLSDYAGQMLRFNDLGWGPSNVEAQADPDVQADEVLGALNAQNAYATPQGQFPNSWWDVTVSLGASMAGSTGTDEELKALLEGYDADLDAILTAVPSDYAVVGNLVDSSWNGSPVTGESPYALYEDNADEGTYKGDGVGIWTVTLEVDTGSGCYVSSEGVAGEADGTGDGDIEVGLFRVCTWDDWGGNYGYTHLTGTIPTGVYAWHEDNNIACVPGTYTLVFDATGETPTLTLAAVAE